jgi:ferric-dicitrate binding protein FerR (iron transport regulator)
MSEQEYIEKWLNNELSEEENSAFEKTNAYESVVKLSKALEAFKAPDFNTQEEFKQLLVKKNSLKSARIVPLPWLQPLMRVAAVLIVLIGVYFIFLSNPSTTITTLASEKSEFLLPDSSSVSLNASSSLLYHPKGWDQKRLVSLDGEAFFKVAKGSKFDVVTNTGTVTVLGTQFNVKSRTNYFEVVCYEGLVQVTSANKTIKLTPTKMFRIVNGIITQDENLSEKLPGWLANESSFESVPFSEVLQEFERQYNLHITTKNVDLNLLFTGRFVHSNLSLAIQSVAIPLNLTYEIDSSQKNVVLSREVK